MMQGEAEENNDGAVLQPDVDIEVAGETVTVRRFRYLESLKVARRASALLDALADVPEDAPMDAVLGILAEHPDTWVDLIATSCDRPTEWVAALDEQDGNRLALTFWNVNQSFFLLRLMMRGHSRAGQSAPSASSASSPKPATENSTSSDGDTPSRNSDGSQPSTAGSSTESAPT